jgi:hypothetical protein
MHTEKQGYAFAAKAHLEAEREHTEREHSKASISIMTQI